MSGNLSVSCVHGIAALMQYAVEIDRLNATAVPVNPFLSAAFLQTYALRNEHHEPGEERVYLVRQGAALVGCVPLRWSADGARVGPARIMGWRSNRVACLAPFDTEYPGIIAAPADHERVASALIQHLLAEGGWDLLEFAGQPPGGSLHRAVHAAAGPRFLARDIPVQPYNVIPLAWNSLDEYFHTLVKKMRSNISRQSRRLFAAGDVQLILAEGVAAASAWFDAYCDLDSRSWKLGTAASIARDARRVAFYRDIVAGKGGLQPAFIGIVLDGVLIAGIILAASPDHAGTHDAWCLEMAYDDHCADLGPGQLLLLLSVGHAIDSRHRQLSFMQNFSYYKHRWGAQAMEVCNVTLARRASLRNLVVQLRSLVRKISRPRRIARVGPDPDDDHHDQGRAKRAPPEASSRDHARMLTSQALASPHSMRCLDRAGARSLLPFPLE